MDIAKLINDPEVQFVLVPTPELKRLLATGSHPHLSKLRADAQAYLLEGKALPVDSKDVLAFVQNKLAPEAAFLLRTGEIRVVGAASTRVSANS